MSDSLCKPKPIGGDAGKQVVEEGATLQIADRKTSPNISTFSYQYSPLPENNIRLLILLPCEDGDVFSPLRCRLLDYAFRGTPDVPDLFEALSYVWGGNEKPFSISIAPSSAKTVAHGPENHCANWESMPITASLRAALLRLRGRGVDRVLWVDAVCINQKDDTEKAGQIRLIAEIYRRADRVVIWLGEPVNGTDHGDHRETNQALATIQAAAAAAGQENTNRWNNTTVRGAEEVLELLRQPWFRRVWVLQEAAAARHIRVKYGAAEMDGYAFYLGIQSPTLQRRLQLLQADDNGYVDDGYTANITSLLNLVRPAVDLMHGSIFRPTSLAIRPSGEASLGIRPLGELLDMYHAHEATVRQDMVFALLGMAQTSSSPDNGGNRDQYTGFDAAGLSPDYTIPWEELLRRVARFVLGDQVSIKTAREDDPAKAVVVIRACGCILAQVSHVDKQRHTVKFILRNKEGGGAEENSWDVEADAQISLAALANPLEVGDLICQLQGCSRPVVLRRHADYFSLVMTAGPHVWTRQRPGRRQEGRVNEGDSDGSVKMMPLVAPAAELVHDFLLVWDWTNSPTDHEASEWKFEAQRHAAAITRASKEQQMEDTTTYREPDEGDASPLLEQATRTWNMGLILEDLSEHEVADAKLLEAARAFEGASHAGRQHSINEPGREHRIREAVASTIRLVRAAKSRRLGQPEVCDATKYDAEISALMTYPSARKNLMCAIAGMRESIAEGMKPGRGAQQRLNMAAKTRLSEEGEKHPRTLGAKEKLAVMSQDTWPKGMARDCLADIAEFRLRTQGPDHLDTINTYERLAMVTESVPEALKLLKLVMQMRKQIQGALHLDTLASIETLERFVLETHPHLGADTAPMRDLVETRIQIQGWNHPDAIRCFDSFESLARAAMAYSSVDARWETGINFILRRTNEISPSLMVTIAHRGRGKMMRLILEREDVKIRVSQDVVEAGAANREGGREVMEALLDCRGDDIRITEAVLMAAILQPQTSVARLLFERREDETRQVITEKVLRAVVAGWNDGIIQLFEESGGFQVTPKVLKDAAKSPRCRDGRAMRFLLEQGVDDALLTEELLLGAANNASAELPGQCPLVPILEIKGKCVKITMEIAQAARRAPWLLQFIYEKREDGDSMSGDLVETMKDMLTWLGPRGNVAWARDVESGELVGSQAQMPIDVPRPLRRDRSDEDLRIGGLTQGRPLG